MNGETRDWKKRLASLNKNTLGIVICASIVVLVLAAFLLARNGGFSHAAKSAESDKETPIPAEAYSQIGDNNMNNVSTDSDDGEKAWKEMDDEEYSMHIQVVPDGWTGRYMEDGSDEKVKNVLALQFENTGDQAVQFAEYVFGIDGEAVSFKLSDLPAGQSCVVLESSRYEYHKRDELKLISRVVAQVDEIPFARDQVLVVDNSDNSITIMNLTDKEIPVVRAFYKTFDSESKMFIGGITYTAKAENIPAGKGVTLEPAHYVSGESVIVGSGVYEAGS